MIPNIVVLGAIVVIPGLLAYAIATVGRWLGGTDGMRIGSALAVAAVSLPLVWVAATYVRLLAEGHSLVPQYGDQLLGLILSALILLGTLAAYATLGIVWWGQLRREAADTIRY